jgi:hypothetical protein
MKSRFMAILGLTLLAGLLAGVLRVRRMRPKLMPPSLIPPSLIPPCQKRPKPATYPTIS